MRTCSQQYQLGVIGPTPVCRPQVTTAQPPTFSSHVKSQAHVCSSARDRRSVVRCAAADNSSNAAPTAVQTGKIGRIVLTKDTESIQDVMAFSGPAPERVNGRLAMLAFVAVAFGELTTGKSVLEQVPTVPFRIIFVSLMISVASIVPKYSSGTSLNELTEAASKTGLPPVLRFFNKTHEVWLGRVAMLGFTGLIIVELIKGGALFKF
ncbi:hypothetical protein ABBQ38_012004 [Trebouxia sp. C0009 RCD-2024]